MKLHSSTLINELKNARFTGDDKKVTVYVCYEECEYDGCGTPDKVFVLESDAIKWKSKFPKHRRYSELEVE